MKKYDLYIVDLDGTLYYKIPVKLCIAGIMILHFWKIKEFKIVQEYRKLFKKGFNEKERYEQLPPGADKIINFWMFEKPLKLLYIFRNKNLIKELEEYMMEGKNVIVYSDYPIKNKLKAIGFTPTKEYSSDEVGCLKPNPEGIHTALTHDKLYTSNCIVIGDRKEKDAALAKNLMVEYRII